MLNPTFNVHILLYKTKNQFLGMSWASNGCYITCIDTDPFTFHSMSISQKYLQALSVCLKKRLIIKDEI